MCFAAERGLPRLRATNTGQEYKDPQFATEEESGLVNLGQQYQVRFEIQSLGMSPSCHTQIVPSFCPPCLTCSMLPPVAHTGAKLLCYPCSPLSSLKVPRSAACLHTPCQSCPCCRPSIPHL